MRWRGKGTIRLLTGVSLVPTHDTCATSSSFAYAGGMLGVGGLASDQFFVDCSERVPESNMALSTLIGLDFRRPRWSNSLFHRPSRISFSMPLSVQWHRSCPSAKSVPMQKASVCLLCVITNAFISPRDSHRNARLCLLCAFRWIGQLKHANASDAALEAANRGGLHLS